MLQGPTKSTSGNSSAMFEAAYPRLAARGIMAIALDTPGALIASLGAPKVVTHEGTLEDVFVALTGRHLRDE